MFVCFCGAGEIFRSVFFSTSTLIISFGKIEVVLRRAFNTAVVFRRTFDFLLYNSTAAVVTALALFAGW